MTKYLKLLVPWGLPGSGKTTYLKSIYNPNNYFYWDLDEVRNKEIALPDIKENTNTLILDTLITNNTLFKNVWNLVNFRELYKGQEIIFEKVEIHYWIPDIDRCIKNDYKRYKEGKRPEPVERFIRECRVELPDLDLLNILGIENAKIIEHRVF